MRRALEASIPAVQSRSLRQWLLLEDSVLFLQAAVAMGAAGLRDLAAEYVANGCWYAAAKTEFAKATVGGSGDYAAVMASMRETLALLGRGDALATPKGQQLGE